MSDQKSGTRAESINDGRDITAHEGILLQREHVAMLQERISTLEAEKTVRVERVKSVRRLKEVIGSKDTQIKQAAVNAQKLESDLSAAEARIRQLESACRDKDVRRPFDCLLLYD